MKNFITLVIIVISLGFIVSKCAFSTPEEKYQKQCQRWKDAMTSKAFSETSRQYNLECGQKYYRYCVDPAPADYERIMREIR